MGLVLGFVVVGDGVHNAADVVLRILHDLVEVAGEVGSVAVKAELVAQRQRGDRAADDQPRGSQEGNEAEDQAQVDDGRAVSLDDDAVGVEAVENGVGLFLGDVGVPPYCLLMSWLRLYHSASKTFCPVKRLKVELETSEKYRRIM